MIATASPKDTAFERKAQSYERYARAQRDSADWLSEWLPQHDVSHLPCLEFGAGTGLFTQYLPARFGQVEASDQSPSMLKICQAQTPGIKIRQRDAWKAQPDHSSWDWIVSSSLMQWADHPRTTLSQWRALLKPHGRVLIGCFIEPSLPEMYSLLEMKPLQWRSRTEWLDIFRQAGFEVLRVEQQSKRYYYLNALALWKGVHGTGATRPQGMSPRNLLQILRKYEAKFKDEQGVYATWTSLRVELKN